ncbi:MAG TPA: L-threonylcarbamoyladenylate synthase [Thermoanaerobaculia bacterium]|nr:L-threonylcarbamoyladenylate synthase [Thermoanaerobaculia bacterium]
MKRWVVRGSPGAAEIEEIAAVIRSGAVILMPTDTIYGLHAMATDESAARIAQIKDRDEVKRFVTIAASIEQLESLGAEVPPVLRDIWPAPLTAVIRRGAQSFAARVPDLQWLRDILQRTGPLISTSANRTGEAPIVEPADLSPELLREINAIVDAGRREGKASAIVDFTGTEPRFIREGEPRFTQMLRKTLMKNL